MGEGVGGGVRNFKRLRLGYAKEIKAFFVICWDRKLNGKFVGGMRNWVSG